MLTVTEHDLELADGRTLHYYDTHDANATRGTNETPEPGDTREPGADTEGARRVPPVAVFWSHGTPNTGEPPGPLLSAAAELGIRLFSCDRPGYGSSTRLPGRRVGDAAVDAAAVADVLGIGEFSLLGHSGGGPHVLACAARLPGRVRAAVSVSGIAPYAAAADGLDYFARMIPAGAAELQAAVAGREQLEALLARGEYDPEMFTPKDHEVLEGEWAWILSVVDKALAGGTGGMVDDDLAYVAPWDADLGRIEAKTLLLHGDQDRVVPVTHAYWLAAHVPGTDLRIVPGDGHVSVLASVGRQALEWLARDAG
jgi:pimeloyl-ACP methyl ester carboxylesterase